MSENQEPEECELCKQFNKPNAETLAAMRELREGGGLRLTGSIQELMDELSSD